MNPMGDSRLSTSVLYPSLGELPQERDRVPRKYASSTLELVDVNMTMAWYRDGTLLKDHELAHVVIAVLMAGQHTSSATGSWALLRPIHNSEIDKAMEQGILFPILQTANLGFPPPMNSGLFRSLA